MAVKFSEAIKDLHKNTKNNLVKRLRLIDGNVLEGTIMETYEDMLVVSRSDQGAGSPKYTVPFTSILYISDCELKD